MAEWRRPSPPSLAKPSGGSRAASSRSCWGRRDRRGSCWRPSPAAGTCCSRTSRAPARRRSPRRSPARSARGSGASSSPRTSSRPTSSASRCTTRGTRRFHFHPGPVFTNILLADEINRASPRTQSALLEAMGEGQVTIEGETPAAGAALLRDRDPEPGGVPRHLPAARGADGPLRAPVPAGLRRAGGRGGGPLRPGEAPSAGGPRALRVPGRRRRAPGRRRPRSGSATS